MNGDGFIDLLYENNGNGKYSTEIVLPGGDVITNGLTLGDLNGYSRVDIMATNEVKMKEIMEDRQEGTQKEP